jgi:hypothetical protein
MTFGGSTGQRNAESRADLGRRALSRVLAAFGAVLFAGLLPACDGDAPPDLPDDRLWESEHFRYHLRSDEAAACEGVTEQLERHFAIVRDYLGFPWPAGAKVDYYKFRDQLDYARESDCPEYGSSCVRDGAVLTARILQHHELIHAYLAPLGLPPQKREYAHRATAGGHRGRLGRSLSFARGRQATALNAQPRPGTSMSKCRTSSRVPREL